MGNPWDDTVSTKEYEKNLKRVGNIAKKKGYVLNPDEERLKKVVGLMTMNYNEFKKYYCPCKQSHPLNPEKDELCPCPDMDDEVKKDGHCFCRLFYSNTK
jgi:ferredoxin-thioredoxin reductase catalytic subunit